MRLFAGTIFDRLPHCERCDQPETECQCPPEPKQPQVVPPGRQTARLSLEKRKKGKFVTVIRGLSAANNDFPTLLSKLKTHCGAGGTLDGDTLEIQGNQLDGLKKKLVELGYQVK